MAFRPASPCLRLVPPHEHGPASSPCSWSDANRRPSRAAQAGPESAQALRDRKAGGEWWTSGSPSSNSITTLFEKDQRHHILNSREQHSGLNRRTPGEIRAGIALWQQPYEVRFGSWSCENSGTRRARRNISEKLRIMKPNHTAHMRLDAVLENCIFYISPLYEFSHSQGHSRPGRACSRSAYVRFARKRSKIRILASAAMDLWLASIRLWLRAHESTP
jgi:hypothetical protein